MDNINESTFEGSGMNLNNNNISHNDVRIIMWRTYLNKYWGILGGIPEELDSVELQWISLRLYYPHREGSIWI